MWHLYCRMVRQPYGERATALDEFRYRMEDGDQPKRIEVDETRNEALTVNKPLGSGQ